jgi:AraC-like DNA-binding protein
VTADPLSDVLHSVRLSGAVFFYIEGTSPWVAEAPPARAIARFFMPGAQHVIEYHVVMSGACWGGIVGERPVRLEAGDVIAFPRGDPHVVSSAPGMRGAIDAEAYAGLLRGEKPLHVQLGGSGPERAELMCGFLGCDSRPFNPLLATLPRVLHARGESRDGALPALIEGAAREVRSRRPGGESVLARFSELMFVEVVRRHLESLPPGGRGWLAGLRDEFVGRALAFLHGAAAHPWTLEALARNVGLSRSALSERFTHLLGEPPMQYLARWRMQVAAGLLTTGSASVAQVASEVGYASEAAFSRAFKKAVGVPPASWRDRRQPGASIDAPAFEPSPTSAPQISGGRAV